MAYKNGPHDRIDDPLYNSRLIKNYVEYLEKFHPNVNIDSILNRSGITNYELEDQGHWFTQRQVDRFYEVLLKKTGNPNIARKVGRYAAASEASGAIRQYVMGFLSPVSVYHMLEKITSNLSRAITLETKQLANNKVEVTASPKPGIKIRPYQCDNMIGMLEAVVKLFTNKFAKIEHPSCLHDGDEYCRYVITWEKSPFLIWKLLRNFLLLSIPASLAFLFILQLKYWLIIVLVCTFLMMIVSLYFGHLEKEELNRTIQTQGDTAKDLLNEMNIRYNNALLVQEIGQAVSSILDIDSSG